MIKEPLQSGISQMQQYKNLSYSSPESGAFEMQTKKKELVGKRPVGYQVRSLEDLISKLYAEFEKDKVDIDHVCDLMTAYKSVPHEWKKYAKFDRYRYTRNLVDSGNGKFNLMILCWGEGHGSAIHDHSDAHCFMKVLDGTLSEVRFTAPDDGIATSEEEESKLKEISRTGLKLNEVCYINDSLGLHRVENPSHVNPAVSLHLYCPPFDSCSVFNQQTGQKTRCKVTFWSKYGESRDRKLEVQSILTNEAGYRKQDVSVTPVKREWFKSDRTKAASFSLGRPGERTGRQLASGAHQPL